MHLHPSGIVERVNLSSPIQRSGWRIDEGFRLVYILSSIKRLNAAERSRRERERRSKGASYRRLVKSQKRIPPYVYNGVRPGSSSSSRERFIEENSTFATISQFIPKPRTNLFVNDETDNFYHTDISQLSFPCFIVFFWFYYILFCNIMQFNCHWYIYFWEIFSSNLSCTRDTLLLEFFENTVVKSVLNMNSIVSQIKVNKSKSRCITKWINTVWAFILSATRNLNYYHYPTPTAIEIIHRKCKL